MEEKYNKAGYVIGSTYRSKVLNAIYTLGHSTPTNIAYLCGIRVNHISKILRELKEAGLVKCINPDVRKGRIYCITDEGEQILKLVNRMRGKKHA